MGASFRFFAGSLALAAATFLPGPLRAAPVHADISFTLTSFGAGDLDKQCLPAVTNAVTLGFTAVTLVPARVFDGHDVIEDGTVTDGEIERCLETAWRAGLDIVYQPHLESDYIIHPGHPAVWRAYFDFKPGPRYESALFVPFLDWLKTHAGDIRAGRRHVAVTVSAELETSTTRYPDLWVQFVSWIRGQVNGIGLGGLIPLGFDPNWWPQPAFTGTAKNCADFKQFVSSLDVVAPSLYGDWSRMYEFGTQTPRGAVQVEDLKVDLLKRLSWYPQNNCSVPEIYGKTFGIGEFGIGGDFQHAERPDPDMAAAPDFEARRRAVYSNLLSWAKEQNFGALPAVNIWTGGIFDPVGVLPDPSGEMKPDPAIAEMLRQYAGQTSRNIPQRGASRF